MVGFCVGFLGVFLVAFYVLWGFSGLFVVFCSGVIRVFFGHSIFTFLRKE